MKELAIDKILDIIEELYGKDKGIMLGVAAPLETEQMALTMLKYLEENKNDKYLMREDMLYRKALEINHSC